jgi:hypothetical protein
LVFAPWFVCGLASPPPPPHKTEIFSRWFSFEFSLTTPKLLYNLLYYL